jgi:hypothetical protein
MGLSDVTGVFSRYFVVGFFMPAYVGLISLWFAASSGFVPDSLEGHAEGTQLLILGAVALVAALVLSGLSYYITRIFEGYPLERLAGWPGVAAVYRAALRRQRRRYDRLLTVRDDRSCLPRQRAHAAWCLDRFFPHNAESLLPTRLGNIMRASEQHSNVRWGLDGVTIWPRIEALLSADERELLVDAKTNFYVFANAAVVALVVGACLVADTALNVPRPVAYWPLYLIPFAISYLSYRAASGPALDWGDSIRASIDLHRLEIYEKLGVRAPISFSDERQLAERVNKAVLFGHPLLGDDLWRETSTEAQNSEAQGGLFAYLKKCLIKGE